MPRECSGGASTRYVHRCRASGVGSHEPPRAARGSAGAGRRGAAPPAHPFGARAALPQLRGDLSRRHHLPRVRLGATVSGGAGDESRRSGAMSTELVHQIPTPLAQRDELGVEDVIAQVQKIQAVMERVMKSGEHYGIIPGTQKPTLLKPGAEKLLLTFRFDPQYESAETYDGKHLIIKSKAEYGGGWLCYGKKGGCGAKWPDGAGDIEGQSVERVANEDLADQYNTVLKMANKRSLVAAVLNVTAASDIFTQDLEDSDVAGRGDTHNGTERSSQPDRGSATFGVRQDAPGDPTRPQTDPETHRAESEALFPSPEDEERRTLIEQITALYKMLKPKPADWATIKTTYLGAPDADPQKADVVALGDLRKYLETRLPR